MANAEAVVAIELLAGSQAVEYLAPLAPGPASRVAREAVRSISPRLTDDRPLDEDIATVASAIRDGSLVASVEHEAGDLL